MSSNNKSIFEYNEGERYLACVGKNGDADDYVIKKGYEKAIYLLIDDAKNEGVVDELVYPIAFCCRHSYELALKIIINGINRIYDLKGLDGKITKLNVHDLESLSQKIKYIYNIDKRIKEAYVGIDDFVSEFKFDRTGAAFRYECDVKGKSSMINEKNGKKEDIFFVSIDVLKDKFEKGMEKLENLISLLDYLNEEYDRKSFTKNLSRNDIENISKKLPEFKLWNERIFNINKEIILKTYNIDDEEFLEAIEIIENNYEFSYNIGKERTVGNITDIELDEYVKILNCEELADMVYDLDKFSDITAKRKERFNYYFDNVKRDSIILIAVFAKINTEFRFFVEDFDKLYKLTVQNYDCVTTFANNNIPSYYLNYSAVIYGMKKMGQFTYANKLTEKYNLYNGL